MSGIQIVLPVYQVISLYSSFSATRSFLDCFQLTRSLDLPQSTSVKTPAEIEGTLPAPSAAGEENSRLSAQSTSLVAALEACADANQALAEEFAKWRGEASL